MRVPYSELKWPSAPVLQFRLTPPQESAFTETIIALVDTGADFTLIPQDILLKINAPEMRWAYIRGLWGEQHPVTLYLVDFHVDNIVLPGIEVAGIERSYTEFDEDNEAILGRNILNKLTLLLDGPHSQTEIL